MKEKLNIGKSVCSSLFFFNLPPLSISRRKQIIHPLYLIKFTSSRWKIEICIIYPSGAAEFTPVFSGVRVIRSLVLCVCFVDRCLSFCAFSFGHCVGFFSSIYGFWLPLWYLQALLVSKLRLLTKWIKVYLWLIITYQDTHW
jgi:hypothetical protein